MRHYNFSWSFQNKIVDVGISFVLFSIKPQARDRPDSLFIFRPTHTWYLSCPVHPCVHVTRDSNTNYVRVSSTVRPRGVCPEDFAEESARLGKNNKKIKSKTSA